MREIVDRLIGAIESGRPVAFCRVVATRGSTPQKAGAAMLLTPDGGQVGTLGGGCVEDQVKRRAFGLIDRPESGAELSRFVLDHDPDWADGLICGGRMVIVADCPRGDAALAYYRAYRDLLGAGRGFSEVVAIDPERSGASAVGDRFLFDPEGRPVGSLSGLGAPAGVVGPTDLRVRASESGGWAYLPTPPRVRLVIVGGGHVGQAVAGLASGADFDVWVVDDRPDCLTRERFPSASRRIVGPIGGVLSGLEINPETYALIVTRGHGHDQEALAKLAPTAASYVGLIGSRRKIRMILDALREEGMAEAALARVSAPVGLDIGSESVAEIAVSIVAELIARRNRGPDGLRALRGPS